MEKVEHYLLELAILLRAPACYNPSTLSLSGDCLQRLSMGVQKKTRKFATVKRIIGQRDARLKKNIDKNSAEEQAKKKRDELIRDVYVSTPSNMATPIPDAVYLDPKCRAACSFSTILLFSRPTRSSSTPTSSPTLCTTSYLYSQPSWIHYTPPVTRSSLLA